MPDEFYPLLRKIRLRLEALDKNVAWLSGQIDRSTRWIDGLKLIDEVTIGILNQLSAALEFDFLADYQRWRAKENPTESNQLAEPAVDYTKKEEPISINIRVTGSAKNASKILTAIQDQGRKTGFKIE